MLLPFLVIIVTEKVSVIVIFVFSVIFRAFFLIKCEVVYLFQIFCKFLVKIIWVSGYAFENIFFILILIEI